MEQFGVPFQLPDGGQGSHGRDLPSSATADPRYNLFYGPAEANYFNDLSVELFEMVAQVSVKYWRIEKDFSNPNNLYGESDSKMARAPVIVYCFLQSDEPITETGRYGTDIKRRMELFMHQTRLTEVGVVPRIGDFVEYDNQFFEIYSSDVPFNTYAQPQTKMGVMVRCLSAREGVFDGMRDDDSQEVVADGANPY